MFKKSCQPAKLSAIIDGFNKQVAELNKRIQFDNEEVERIAREQERLEKEKTILKENSERGLRIRDKIVDLIA